MFHKVGFDLAIGLEVGVAGIEHTHTLKAILRIELGGQSLERCLVAPVIAHKDNVFETRPHHAVSHLFVYPREGPARKVDGAREAHFVGGGRERHDRCHQGVA